MLAALCDALGATRNVLAADDQIEHAWANLPRLLARIPPQHRNETLVRMCVAVATGLFDSAINYAWNAAIVELRDKVRRFGLAVVPQVISKPFDEAALLDLKDADLLHLCLTLNLISDHKVGPVTGIFASTCRFVRNTGDGGAAASASFAWSVTGTGTPPGELGERLGWGIKTKQPATRTLPMSVWVTGGLHSNKPKN
jgi:hypothetical protein